jgi:hypothetical protein
MAPSAKHPQPRYLCEFCVGARGAVNKFRQTCFETPEAAAAWRLDICASLGIEPPEVKEAQRQKPAATPTLRPALFQTPRFANRDVAEIPTAEEFLINIDALGRRLGLAEKEFTRKPDPALGHEMLGARLGVRAQDIRSAIAAGHLPASGVWKDCRKALVKRLNDGLPPLFGIAALSDIPSF